MIVNSDTVADPGAVVVHAHDTTVADAAVVGTRRTNDIALEAVTPPDEV
jgi:S1-C subfamily serine protease